MYPTYPRGYKIGNTLPVVDEVEVRPLLKKGIGEHGLLIEQQRTPQYTAMGPKMF